MGAADGAIFTRHRVQVGGFDVSYLKGGQAGDTAPVLYLHGMGGAGRWEAYHMALGTVPHLCAPVARLARRPATDRDQVGAGLCRARGRVA